MKRKVYLSIGIALIAVIASVYVVYANSHNDVYTGAVYGRLWDGTSWHDEEQATTYDVSNQYFCKFGAVGIGNNVHVVFVNDTDGLVFIVKSCT